MCVSRRDRSVETVGTVGRTTEALAQAPTMSRQEASDAIRTKTFHDCPIVTVANCIEFQSNRPDGQNTQGLYSTVRVYAPTVLLILLQPSTTMKMFCPACRSRMRNSVLFAPICSSAFKQVVVVMGQPLTAYRAESYCGSNVTRYNALMGAVNDQTFSLESKPCALLLPGQVSSSKP